MRTLQAISTFLLLIAVGFFLFDLMYQWALHGQFKVLSIEAVWTDTNKDSYESVQSIAETIIPTDQWLFFSHLPAALVLLIIAAVFYLPFRLLSLLGLGKKKEK